MHEAVTASPCPAGRSVPGRGGPERRRRPRPDGTGILLLTKLLTGRDATPQDERVQGGMTRRHPSSSRPCRAQERTGPPHRVGNLGSDLVVEATELGRVTVRRLLGPRALQTGQHSESVARLHLKQVREPLPLIGRWPCPERLGDDLGKRVTSVAAIRPSSVLTAHGTRASHGTIRARIPSAGRKSRRRRRGGHALDKRREPLSSRALVTGITGQDGSCLADLRQLQTAGA